MRLQNSQSPARLALLRLLATDDSLPTDRQAVALLNRPDVLVVIVDTPAAWGVWVHAIGEAAGQPTEYHRGEHLLTAENVVAGWPVQVVKTAPFPAEHLAVAA